MGKVFFSRRQLSTFSLFTFPPESLDHLLAIHFLRLCLKLGIGLFHQKVNFGAQIFSFRSLQERESVNYDSTQEYNNHNNNNKNAAEKS